ncbi:MAG: M20/M25/M40 family metallo-hydrolase [Anaerolineaceae bacterium]|nr:M20/M25/M40 family metallo-hydrolase [Anaerolineaceae bacterium]
MDLELEAVDFLCRLVQQPSISGREESAVRVVIDEMQRLGFDEVWQDETGSPVGVLQGQRPGRQVIFDAHVDVVPVTTPDAWQHSPFSGDLQDGLVWGRGACDNKGSLAAMISGLAAIPRSELAGKLYVVGSVGEEIFEGVGLAPLVDSLKPDFVVVGEPTDCRLGYGSRGRSRLLFRVRGAAAHSSSEDQSHNAIYAIGRLIQAIQSHPLPQDAWLGRGIQAPIELISNPYPSASTMPVECRLIVDRRLVLGETEPAILAGYQPELADLPGASVELDLVNYTSYNGYQISQADFHPARVTEPGTPYMQACIQAVQQAGLPAELYTVPYCTNAAYSAGTAGIPAVIFGPGSISHAHVMDEFLEVAQFYQALKAYQAMALALGKVNPTLR